MRAGRLLVVTVAVAILEMAMAEVGYDLTYFLDLYQDMMQRTGKFLGPYNDYGYSLPRAEIAAPPSDDEEYDFIIVGSGPAGSVLANRLSEVPKWRVLLLEVGEIPSTLSDIPMLAGAFLTTNYNWGYLAEKQDNFGFGFVDQRLPSFQGRALGGTSILSYGVHARGNRHDYDGWEKLGNKGWSYEDVLPFFIKSENSEVEDQEPVYHGTGGYLNVEDVPYRTEAAHAFVKAAQELGHDYVDYNGHAQLGVSFVHSTAKGGRKCSAEKAFLRPVRFRPNLTILTKSRATKILIEPETNKAFGVEYIRNRRYRVARASKEVVVSAGAINSPQLLMLSGVGPRKHLQELGIPVIEDLPVGQNMHDHVLYLGLTFQVNQSVVLDETALADPDLFAQYLFRGSGPLTSLGGAEASLYLKTNASAYPEDYPDVEVLFVGEGLHLNGGAFLRHTLRVSDDAYGAVWGSVESRPTWTAFPTLLHPKSSGEVRLRSRNPFRWPRIHGNHLTDPDGHDTRVLIAGIRRVQALAGTAALGRYGSRQVRGAIRGCEGHGYDTDAYWECGLRNLGSSAFHKGGTCRMGPPSDREAVVDSRLRVYGMRNLRVADASVMPTAVSGHPAAPTYMIGEKAAHMVKEDWSNERSYIDPKYIRRSLR